MALYSFIVPIHNGEQNLSRCVQSVLNQLDGDLEVLLINAASTDQSLAICKQFMQQDRRIKVVDLPTANLGVAKNQGLNIATGEFVSFLSPDDVIDSRFGYYLRSTLQDEQSNLIACQLIQTNSTGATWLSLPANENRYNGIYTNRQWMEIAPQYLSSIYGTAKGKIFQRDLFDDIRFPQDLQSDGDINTLWKVYLKAQRIIYIPSPLYTVMTKENQPNKQTLIENVQAIEEQLAMRMVLRIPSEALINEYRSGLNQLKTAANQVNDRQVAASASFKLTVLNSEEK